MVECLFSEVDNAANVNFLFNKKNNSIPCQETEAAIFTKNWYLDF